MNSIRFIIDYLVHPVFDFFYPPICHLCDASLNEKENLICKSCWSNIPYNQISLKSNQISSISGEKFFSEFHWCFTVQDEVLEIIHLFKYRGYRKLRNQLSSYLIRKTEKILSIKNIDLLVPVPLHKKREQQRGFNQSFLLCENITEETKIPSIKDLLIRTKNNISQTGLNREERAVNVKNIFSINKDYDITGKTILILDDVFTTGATINECANVLMKNGAREVTVLTLLYAE